jgi:hypothetical protein
MKQLDPNAKPSVSYSLIGGNYCIELHRRGEINDFVRLAQHKPDPMSDGDVESLLEILNRRARCGYDVYRTSHTGMDNVLPWKYLSEEEKEPYHVIARKKETLQGSLFFVNKKLGYLNIPFFAILDSGNEVIDGKVMYVDPVTYYNEMASPYFEHFDRCGGIAHYHNALIVRRKIPKNSKILLRQTAKQIPVPIRNRLKVNEKSLEENVRSALKELCRKFNHI